MNISILDQNKVYAELDEQLFNLGIVTKSIRYFYSNSIDIWIKNICEMESTQRIVADNRKELSDFFIKKWTEQGGKVNPDYYGEEKYLFFNIYSTQDVYIHNLLRNSRDEILKSLENKVPSDFIPKHIFCHSSNYDRGNQPPGYNIVFKNPEILKQSYPDVQNIIRTECIKILTNHHTDGSLDERLLQISYYDCTFENMYGLARED